MWGQRSGTDRQWITDTLSYPFGRDINFEWEVADVEALYTRAVLTQKASIYLAIESKTHQCGNEAIRQT